MATVIQGSVDEWRALAYSTPSREYIDDFIEMSDRYDNLLIGRARDMYHSASNRFRDFSFRRSTRRAKSALRRVNNMFNYDGVYELRDIGEFQHAKTRNRRFVMSEPTVRRMYYDNRVEGYGDLYEDVYKGRVGESDPLYRMVMSGIWQESSEGEDYFVEYWDTEETELEEPITVEEQFDVVNSWERLRILLDKMEDDPTSPYNQQL